MTMAFTVQHPRRSDEHAEYGVDPVRGCFVDIIVAGKVLAKFDTCHPDYDICWPVLGMLGFMAGFGFFDLDDLDEAFGPRKVGGRARRARRVLVNLRAAAE